MISEIFDNLIDSLRSTAPISIFSNIVICIVTLVVGLILLLKKQQQTRGKKMGGWICVVISILAFLGAISNWFFTYIIFV